MERIVINGREFIFIRNTASIRKAANYLSTTNEARTMPVDLIFDVPNKDICVCWHKRIHLLETVVFLSPIHSISQGSFYSCGIKSVQFYSSVGKIEQYAFGKNPLTEVVMASTSNTDLIINDLAFADCGAGNDVLTFIVPSETRSRLKEYCECHGFGIYFEKKKHILSRIDSWLYYLKAAEEDASWSKRMQNQFPVEYALGLKENESSPDKQITTRESTNQNTRNRTNGDDFSIVTKDFSVRFGNKYILQHIDLSITSGEMIMIIGGSGCGKSTLVKQLFGIELSDNKNTVTIKRGTKTIEGTPNDKKIQNLLKGGIYYAPQFTISNEKLTVEQEIQKNAKMFRGRFYSSIELKTLAVKHHLYDDELKLLRTKVGKISGGQRKKLLMACSESVNPLLFVFDEPDSGLDEPSSFSLFIQELCREQVKKRNKTVIVISHHPHNFMSLFRENERFRFDDVFSRLIVLAKHSFNNSSVGTIAFDGSPIEARRFFGLADGELYSRITSKVMLTSEGGESTQVQIDGMIDRFRKRN